MRRAIARWMRRWADRIAGSEPERVVSEQAIQSWSPSQNITIHVGSDPKVAADAIRRVRQLQAMSVRYGL